MTFEATGPARRTWGCCRRPAENRDSRTAEKQPNSRFLDRARRRCQSGLVPSPRKIVRPAGLQAAVACGVLITMGMLVRCGRCLATVQLQLRHARMGRNDHRVARQEFSSRANASGNHLTTGGASKGAGYAGVKRACSASLKPHWPGGRAHLQSVRRGGTREAATGDRMVRP